MRNVRFKIPKGLGLFESEETQEIMVTIVPDGEGFAKITHVEGKELEDKRTLLETLNDNIDGTGTLATNG